jgi:hypothetical protein
MISVVNANWTRKELILFLNHVPNGTQVEFDNCQFVLNNLDVSGWPGLTLSFTNTYFYPTYEESYALGRGGWHNVSDPSPEDQ